MRGNNIHITEVSEREDREQQMENLFEEIMAENFPSLVGEKDSPGSSDSPKQDKPKEDHTRKHHN